MDGMGEELDAVDVGRREVDDERADGDLVGEATVEDVESTEEVVTAAPIVDGEVDE